jgi:hypothetical protein
MNPQVQSLAAASIIKISMWKKVKIWTDDNQDAPGDKHTALLKMRIVPCELGLLGQLQHCWSFILLGETRSLYRFTKCRTSFDPKSPKRRSKRLQDVLDRNTPPASPFQMIFGPARPSKRRRP